MVGGVFVDVFFFHVENVQIIPKKKLYSPWNQRLEPVKQPIWKGKSCLICLHFGLEEQLIFRESKANLGWQSAEIHPTALPLDGSPFSLVRQTKNSKIEAFCTNRTNPWYFSMYFFLKTTQMWKGSRLFWLKNSTTKKPPKSGLGNFVKSPCCSSPRWFHPDQTTPGCPRPQKGLNNKKGTPNHGWSQKYKLNSRPYYGKPMVNQPLMRLHFREGYVRGHWLTSHIPYQRALWSWFSLPPLSSLPYKIEAMHYKNSYLPIKYMKHMRILSYHRLPISIPSIMI